MEHRIIEYQEKFFGGCRIEKELILIIYKFHKDMYENSLLV